MVTLKERINLLHLKESFKDVENLSDPVIGYFPRPGADAMGEFLSWAKKFMQQYNIGKYLSVDKWGSRRVGQINTALRRVVEPPKDRPQVAQAPKSSLQVYDDLKKDVTGKQFTNYDFERVARTETAAMKSVYQLLKWKEAGIIYVTHKNNQKSVSKGTVARRDKLYNNREFKIDYLLSKVGEKDRIPLHPNCLCHYQLSMKGLN